MVVRLPAAPIPEGVKSIPHVWPAEPSVRRPEATWRLPQDAEQRPKGCSQQIELVVVLVRLLGGLHLDYRRAA
jgi:hypothetical protein